LRLPVGLRLALWIRCLFMAWGTCLLGATQAPNPVPVRIGVLAHRPVPLVQAQWEPMAAALHKAMPHRTFVVEALSYPDLTRALAEGQLDFAVTNPGHFVQLNRQGILSSPLATLAVFEAGHPTSVFGGVIFCRSGDPRPDALENLKGQKIAIPSLDSLGGYQMQAHELLHAGIRLPEDANLIITGMPHDNVVEAVLAGAADTGFVRTGVLESMAQEGKLDRSRIRILNERIETGFTTRSSTPRYPEWPFAAASQTDEVLARHVASALFVFERDPALTKAMGIHGFLVPADYSAVEGVLRDLRIPPFDATPNFTLRDVGKRFVWPLAGAALAICLILVLSISLQVANRRLAQEKERVLLQQERLDLALSATGLGLYDWNPLTGVVVYDERWAAMFGHRLDELTPDFTTWSGRVHPDDLAHSRAAFEHASQGHVPYTCEYRMRHQDGSWRWILDQGRIVSRDAEGHPLRVVGANLDITERKYLESQLSHSQKMEGLGILAGGVAHDMNNVLGAILGLASIHLELQPPGTPIYKSLQTITKACNRGKELIQRLLGFARQRLAEGRELDLNTLISDEVRLLERTTLARVRLQVELADGLRPIRGDAGALSQLLMNLCVNGVDAMPEGGVLILRTRNLEGAWVEVQVEDTGIGMSSEVLAKATAPFFTTKEQGKGTGLGLSIAHSTMTAHQGSMKLHSEPGLGTCVSLRFPTCESASPESESEATPALTAALPAGAPLHILLVDDDELIRQSMQSSLELMGHHLTTASSGEAALQQVESGLQPDVVILDMNMPGLGGSGTLPPLRALCPGLPIILATGRVDQRALDLVEAHAPVALLPKPFDMATLREHLDPLVPA